MKRRPHPYDLTTHDGQPVDWLTHAALLKAEDILGYRLTILQGSYQATTGDMHGAKASAGTHDGGGAVDLAPWDWQSKVRALRLSGIVAWHRPEIPGLWGEHIHGILMGDRKMSSGAHDQINAYHHGLDGLADRGPDPHKNFVFRGFHWPYFGVIGLVRWHRDQLKGKRRRHFQHELELVAHGK